LEPGVCRAKGHIAGAEEASKNFARIYWRPLYAFLRGVKGTIPKSTGFNSGIFPVGLNAPGTWILPTERERTPAFLSACIVQNIFLAGERRPGIPSKRGYANG